MIKLAYGVWSQTASDNDIEKGRAELSVSMWKWIKI